MGIAIAQAQPRALARTRSTPDAAPTTAPPSDGFLDSLSKLVPGEVLAGYVAALQAPGVDGHRAYHLAILALFAALSPLVLWGSARRGRTPAHWLQYVVRTAAFVLVAAGGDPVLLGWLDGLRFIPSVGAIVVVTLAAVILVPPATTPPPPR